MVTNMDKVNMKTHLRNIPQVNEVLKFEKVNGLLKTYPRRLVVEAIREVLEKERWKILENKGLVRLEESHLSEGVKKKLEEKLENRLKKVINATGVVIHTNLGRSLLSNSAISHLIEVAKHYNNLEFDLEKGKRGFRYSHVEPLLCELTRAEAAMVVNNNAGAVFLILNTLAYGKKVIVSRGQLIEIGGSFRIPDVMKSSGAILIEVGTTNRTHLYDYENAIDEQTALLLKVHMSNYKIVGFTKEVSLEELVELGRKYHIPVVEDLGSGNLIMLSKYGLEKEPTVQEVISAGVDVVSFSGDKLLGGPQAGIILGKGEFVEKIKKNPINRALRIDKFTLAALESTLKLYKDEELAIKKIPTLRLLTTSPKTIYMRARRLKNRLKHIEGLTIQIKESISRVGGGALPIQTLPTFVVVIKPMNISVTKFEERLRYGSPPIIGRIEEDEILLDIRTVQDEDLPLIPKLIKQALERSQKTENRSQNRR